jgi:hypothetical protein
VTTTRQSAARDDEHFRRDAGVVWHVPGVIEVVDRVEWQEDDPKPTCLHDTDWR